MAKKAKVPNLEGERRLKADAWFASADFGCEVTDTQGWEWNSRSNTIKRTIHVINPDSDSTEHGTREITVTFKKGSDEIVGATFEGNDIFECLTDEENSFQVWMHSSEFGNDTYNYDSLDEARAGFKRLKKQIRKYQKKDKVQRTLELVQVLRHETINPE